MSIEEEPLPNWAKRRCDSFTYMAQLPTKDGRCTGNAVLWDYTRSQYTNDMLAIVVTDAGNIMKLTHTEISDLFHKPEYVMEALLPAHLTALQEQGYIV